MTQENNTSGFNKSLSTTRRLKSLSDRPPLRFVVLNRGESAVRFMRSARVWSRRRGRPIELIAVYTDPDAQALFVQMADRGIKLGDPFFVDTDGQRKSSYLDVERMVQLAQEAEADALWPGWGFLGESAELSQACHEVGITFIGPKAGVMKMLGDKVESKTFAQDHNVPVSPWSNGTVEDVQEALKIGERLGYPLIVKAAAGGGGRGIRRVDRPEDLELAFHTARAEAGSAFGDNSLFIETYVDDARHVEVQIVADMFGTVWSLGTRDCSVQRRHQKVLEETPAPALGEGMEERICAAARNMAGSCGYLGAGTAEFLLLPDAQTFYFLEMNARLQVEHTISECVYGVDLVAHQIDIAFGEALPEEPPARRGAAIEARLNAEEPDHGFAPAGGKIHVFEMPGGPGVRVDSGYRQGDSVPTAFDSNIAKIIAYGGDREEAIARLEQALRDTRVVLENGLTNRAMIIEVLTDAEFQRAEMTTGWLAGFLERRPTSLERPLLAQSLVSAALFDHIDSRDSERTALFANIHAGLPQRLPEPQPAHFRYMVDGSPVTVDIGSLGPNQYQVAIGDWATLCRVEDTADGVVTFLNGARYTALCARGASWVQVNTHDFSHRFERVPDGVITADMGSVVTSIAVEPGQQVERGDLLMTVEVMKMEIHINAPLDGVVKAVPVSPSMQVNIGDPLLELTPVSGDGAEVEEAKVPIHEPEVRAGVAIVLAGAILGYDVSDAQVERIMKQLRRDPQLMTVDEMLTVLEAYNTQRALFSANPNEDAINEARESSINQTHWFLMHRQFDTERLHPKTITRLERMFALHDAMGQGGADHIDDYLYRMVQVYLRDADRTNVLVTLLEVMLERALTEKFSEPERLVEVVDELIRIADTDGAHALTLRAQHLAHRVRRSGAPRITEDAGSEHPLLDKAMAYTVTLKNFDLRPLPISSTSKVRCALARAHEEPRDRRVLAFGALPNFEPREFNGTWSCPHVTSVIRETMDELRQALLDYHFDGPWHWNRITLLLDENLDVSQEAMLRVISQLDTQQMDSLELEKLVVLHAPQTGEGGWKVELTPTTAWNGKATVTLMALDDASIQSLSGEDHRLIRARRRRQMTPNQLIERLVDIEGNGVKGQGTFIEYDLDEAGAQLVAVEGRDADERTANLVTGLISHPHERFEGGLKRVIIIGDVTRKMGSLTEAECRRVSAALDMAAERGLPVEWVAFSAGAKISFETGTENLDWTARVLRRIIEFTLDGGVIHVLVDGPCVGAQSYWNAEATMLMHCKGALFMTPRGFMVLTGKRALEHSGSVSGPSNEAIGGLPIMAPNGEAQYIAPTLADAYEMLMRHYLLTYIIPGEAYTRRVKPTDFPERDVTQEPYTGTIGDFETIGDIFSIEKNPDRKKAFDIRAVMGAVVDRDVAPLERWQTLEGGESSVIMHAQLGGQPVTLVGIESMPMQRKGINPTFGPASWTGGTLYPQSSRKIARAIHAASGVQPVVVLANLSGFDGSPESLRNHQLEFGAEIGRAVVQFDGPIVFCVISRYHGGAYVVFSQSLNERLEALALEGSFASVIGGGPAAAVVFPRLVTKRVDGDERVRTARAALERGEMDELQFDMLRQRVRAEIQSSVAREFDGIHTVERAREVGSLSSILSPRNLRAKLCIRTQRAVEAYLESKSAAAE